MRALGILFHMGYGSLPSSYRWLTDRPKCEEHLVDPRSTQKYAWKYLLLRGNSNYFFDQQVVQSLLIHMRYDSLFSSKKRPSDRSKRFGTPTFWPSHSVKLIHFPPNYSFSNLYCSGLGWENFLKLDFLVSKWPKFNIWFTFLKMVTDFIYLRPP